MDQIGLEGVENVRQLGGIPLAGGRMVKEDCLLRSGQLFSMTQEDRRILMEDYHLTEVIDLRTPVEISQYPDPELDGVRILSCSILPQEVMGISHEESEAEDPLEKELIYVRSLNGRAREEMSALYPLMVTRPHCIAKLREFFDILLNHGEGAVLWHCTLGKDRTGITAMLLLEALGADRQDIIDDYIETNVIMQDSHRQLRERIIQQTGDEALAEQALITDCADAAYMESVYETLESEWGSVDDFLTRAMGLTPEKRQILTDRYTRPRACEP